MKPGEAKVGDQIYYIAFDHPAPEQPAAKLHHVQIEDITYRGTSHETLTGYTYEPFNNKKIMHVLSAKQAYWTKEDALDQGRMQLISEMENLKKKAICLGFYLG